MPLAGQVDRDIGIPVFRCDMPDRRQRGQDRGIRHKSVKAAPPFGNGGGKPWHGGCVLHVHLDDGGVPANGLDLVINLFKGADCPPGDDQLGTGRGSGHGNRPADAARRAGYQNQLSGQIGGGN